MRYLARWRARSRPEPGELVSLTERMGSLTGYHLPAVGRVRAAGDVYVFVAD